VLELEWKRNLDYYDWIFGRRCAIGSLADVHRWLPLHKDGWFVSSTRSVVVLLGWGGREVGGLSGGGVWDRWGLGVGV